MMTLERKVRTIKEGLKCHAKQPLSVSEPLEYIKLVVTRRMVYLLCHYCILKARHLKPGTKK